MKINRKKSAVAATAISAVLLAGGATIAAAAPDISGSTGSSPSSTEKGGDKEGDEASITGTIKAPDEGKEGKEARDGSPEDKAQEDDQTVALAGLATMTEDQARTAATGAVPGTVNAIQLGDEDGFVVWEAEVVQTDGTVVEVLVDAGDGSVLAQETEGGNESEGNESDGDGESDDDGAESGDQQAPGVDQQDDLQEATPSN